MKGLEFARPTTRQSDFTTVVGEKLLGNIIATASTEQKKTKTLAEKILALVEEQDAGAIFQGKIITTGGPKWTSVIWARLHVSEAFETNIQL